MAFRWAWMGAFAVAAACPGARAAEAQAPDPKPEPPGVVRPDGDTPLPPLPDDPVKRMEERARRIRERLDVLGSDDPSVRDRARRELVEMGPDAIPFVEEILRKRGVLEHARLLERLEEQAAPGRPLDPRAFDRSLPAPADAEKAAKTAPPGDRYVYAKYNEAVILYQKKEFERAFALVTALAALEPKSPLRTKIGELRRYAEHQLMQQQFLATVLVPEKEDILIGDDVRLQLRFENLTDAPIRLEFGAAGNASSGKVVGDVVATMYDPLGMRRTLQGSVEWATPGEIVVPPKGRWEQPVVVKPNAAEEEAVLDTNMLRVIQVSARLVAVRVWIGDQRERRRVESEFCAVRAWPRNAAWRDPDPLVGLGKTLDDMKATLNDLFMAALRVPKKDADKAANLLVQALPRFSGPARQVILEALRELTGLDYGYDVKKWLEWGKVKIEVPPKRAPAPPKPDGAPDAKPDDGTGAKPDDGTGAKPDGPVAEPARDGPAAPGVPPRDDVPPKADPVPDGN
jgi:hypothetical protein